MTQVKFMDDIVDEYRRLFRDDETAPLLLHYVSNDMSSNYYFSTRDGKASDDNGNLFYVDQFTLQEWFDCSDYAICEDRDNCTCYEDSDIEDKAYALQELAYVTCGGEL